MTAQTSRKRKTSWCCPHYLSKGTFSATMVSSSFEKVSGYSSRIPTSLQSVYQKANRGVLVKKEVPRDLSVLFGKLRDNPQFKQHSTKLNNEKFVFATKPVPIKASYKSVKPQDHLDAILTEHGYRKTTVRSLQTSLAQRPTDLQQASYGQYIQRLVKDGETEAFVKCIQAGLSPNPCNKFGESLLHLVCRYGNHELLRRMIWDLDTNVLVCDDYGRTALHDACWGNDEQLAFGVVDLLVQTIGDASFFLVEDKRGFLPLAYVKKDSWAAWNDYLDRRKDAFFPFCNRSGSSSSSYYKGGRTLACAALHESPFSRTIPDPKRALSIETAMMVASGKSTCYYRYYHHHLCHQLKRHVTPCVLSYLYCISQTLLAVFYNLLLFCSSLTSARSCLRPSGRAIGGK
jgi:Ankyrin repeats (3 copies)